MNPLVLMTGPTGRMGGVLRPALRERYGRLRLMTRRRLDDLAPQEEAWCGDLTDADAVRSAVAGVDVVLHLGGIADESPFDRILASNVLGTYHLFEAARLEGVRRVVFASSNHVTGFYPTNTRIGVHAPPRPDTLYAASKVFGEALGQLYHDKWGLEVVSLRIGSFRDEPQDARQLSTWLSHRDGIELIARAIEAPAVGALTIYGVSANTRSYWQLQPEAQTLGYVPQDDAELFASKVDEPADGGGADRQGGGFTQQDYTGGYW